MAEIVLQSISHSYEVTRGTPDRSERRGAAPSYALRDIELRWRDGGAYALLGPSGCGKTTLLGIISGLVRPTRGQVLYGGKDVTQLSSRERNIAQVFQFPVIYDTMTVYQNLAFPLRNRGLAAPDVDRRVRRIAETLELTEMLHHRATRLTADQKQILALGRGLVREDVAAILFDEPLTVIDPHKKWLLRRKLKEIHKQFRHTLIYVTHDQTEALTFADEVVVMQHGQVLQRGTPEDLFRRPAHTYVGYFIGSPGMNLLPCEIERHAGGATARVGEHAIPLSPGMDPAATPSGSLELGIRPEHIVVLHGEPAESGLPVAVTAVEDHGRFRIATGWLGGCRIKIRIGHAASPEAPVVAAGRTIAVRFQPEHICLYRDSRIVSAGDGPRIEASA
ncbi:MAG TPA: ABC transporter ATP-binding protein [Kofleriaceae bacterium]|jgi:glycerol transport system ATP-binding protein|nr:ABC transporter ATP-binding protein [Kofleriaceae bacterium]